MIMKLKFTYKMTIYVLNLYNLNRKLKFNETIKKKKKLKRTFVTK